jgi:hypothetical protein
MLDVLGLPVHKFFQFFLLLFLLTRGNSRLQPHGLGSIAPITVRAGPPWLSAW